MITFETADLACKAAQDLDNLRLGRLDMIVGAVPELVATLKEAYPAGEEVITGRICPRDVIVAKGVLDQVRPATRHIVAEVVRDVNAIADEMAVRWSQGLFDQRDLDFSLVLSRFVSAACGRSGHTFLA